MSTLLYGGQPFLPVKTEAIEFSPVPTEDGADLTVVEVDLTVRAWFHPGLTATLTAPVFVGGRAGDRAGLTLANLQTFLMTPRLALVYLLGPDAVVSQPAGIGVVLQPTDARYGPVPVSVRILQVGGDRSAEFLWRVRCWVNTAAPPPGQSPPVVLANRFTMRSETDEDHYESRHVKGQLVVRGDLMSQLGIVTPDQFRGACCLPILPGFRRTRVDVEVSSDNLVLDYGFTDTEQPLALGGSSFCTRLEGNATAAVTYPLHDFRQAASAGLSMAGAALGAVRGWFAGGLAGIMGGAADVFKQGVQNTVPRVEMACLVRLWGDRRASKLSLYQLGTQVILDRFRSAPAGFVGVSAGPANLVSLVCTQDHVERFVEVRGEAFATLKALGQAVVGDAIPFLATFMNFASFITSSNAAGTISPLSDQPGASSPAWPASGSTRGNSLASVVAALLGTPGTVPALPPVGSNPDSPLR